MDDSNHRSFISFLKRRSDLEIIFSGLDGRYGSREIGKVPYVNRNQIQELKWKQMDVFSMLAILKWEKNFDVEKFSLDLKDPMEIKLSGLIRIINLVYQCIMWAYDSEHVHTEEELELFVQKFLQIGEYNRKYNKTVNFAFRVLLHIITSNDFSYLLKYDNPILHFNYFIRQFETMVPDSYVPFVQYLNSCLLYSSKAVIIDVFHTVHLAVSQKRAFIMENDISFLARSIQPYVINLDNQALSISSLLTHFSESSDLKELYRLLPASLFFTSARQIKDLPMEKCTQCVFIGDIDYSYSFRNLILSSMNINFPERAEDDNITLDFNELLCDSLQGDSIIICSCLLQSSMSYRMEFFSSFIGFLLNMVSLEQVLHMTSVFLYILKTISLKNVHSSIFDLLFQTIILSPNYCIYHETGIDERIIKIRHFFVKLVLGTNQGKITEIFIRLYNYPLVLSEFCSMILYYHNVFDYLFLNDQQIYDSMFPSIHYLLRQIAESSNKSIESAFRSITLFFFSLFERFEVQKVHIGLLNLVYCEAFHEMAVFVINRSLITESGNQLILVFDFFQSILEIANESHNSTHINIAIIVLREIFNGVLHSFSLCEFIFSHISSIISLLELVASIPLYEKFVKTLFYLSNKNIRFSLDASYYVRLIELSNTIYDKRPSLIIMKWLFRILYGSQESDLGTVFYIFNPDIIPLLIGSFANSDKFIEIITRFGLIASFSLSNCYVLHQCGFDNLLIDLLNSNHRQKKIVYRDVTFYADLSSSNLSTPLLNILSTILQSFSDCDVIDRYSNQLLLFQSINFDKFFRCMYLSLIKCVSNIGVYRIGSYPEHSSIIGLPNSIINMPFTIEFKLYIETDTLSISNCSVILFSMKDNNSSITFYCMRDSICVRYEDSEDFADLVLYRSIPDKLKVSLKLFCRKESDNLIFTPHGIDICPSSKNLFIGSFSSCDSVCIGGYVNNQMSDKWFNKPFGEIYDLEFYQKAIDSDEQNIFPCCTLTKEITPKCVHSNALEAAIGLSFSNYLSRIIIQSTFFPKNSLEYIFASLKLVFENSVPNQASFDSLSLIVNHFLLNDTILSYDIYISVFDIFETITLPSLKFDWFHELLTNVQLWTKIGVQDLILVIVHWKYSLLFAHPDLFLKKSDFSAYLVFFGGMFSTVETSSISDVILLRKEFSEFIGNLLKLRVSKKDIDSIYENLFLCIDIESQKLYIDYLLSIPHERFSQFVHDNDIILKLIRLMIKPRKDMNPYIILLIHRMSLNVISTSLVHLLHSINELGDLNSLYNFLLSVIDQYPNLLPLLCLLSIKIDNCENCSLLESIAFFPDIFPMPMWFIWPIILALKSKNSQHNEMFIKYIGYQMIKSSNQQQIIDEIFDFIEVIRAMTMMPVSDFMHAILEILSANCIPEVIQCIINRSFFYVFFRFNGDSHSQQLLDLFLSSPFCTQNISYPRAVISTIRTPEDFVAIAMADITSLSYTFFIEINDNNVKDQKILNLMNNLIAINEIHFKYVGLMKIIIQYYQKSFQMSPNFPSIISLRFIENLALLSEEYHNSIYTRVVSFFSELKAAYTLPNEAVMLNSHCSNNRNNSPEKMITNQYFEAPKMIRDSICCIYRLPVRYKLHNLSRVNTLLPFKANEIISIHCIWKKLCSSSECLLNVYNDEIRVLKSNSTKSIMLKHINLVLLRKFNGKDNGLELFLESGKSYLFELLNAELFQINRIISILSMNSIQRLQKSFSNEFFLSQMLAQKWENGLISNFRYLVSLNLYSGRSINDLKRYPIFPVLISDAEGTKCTQLSYSKNHSPQDMPRIWLQPCKTDFLKIFEGNHCIHQDYFCFPGIIQETDTLPQWAYDRYDFIYKHRKLLESPEVTLMLPSWIDRFFGCLSTESDYFRLFQSPHPSRSNKQELFNFPPRVILESSILWAYPIHKTFNTIEILYVTSGFSIHTLVVESDFVTTPAIIGDLPKVTDYRFHSSETAFAMTSYSKQLVSFSINQGPIAIHSLGHSSLPMFLSNHTLYYAVNKTTIYKMELDLPDDSSIVCSFNSEITNIFHNPHYKYLLVSTKNQELILFDMVRSIVFHTYPINYPITHIFLSYIWCNVVAFTDSKLLIYSNDTNLIMQYNLSFKIVKAFCFCTSFDSDYLAYTDKSNHLYLLCISSHSQPKCIYKADSEVLSVTLMAEYLIVVTKGNGVFFLPFTNDI